MPAAASSTKKSLRSSARARRLAMADVLWRDQCARICERLLGHPAVIGASQVGLFWPMLTRKEVDLRQLDATLRQRGVEISYPYMVAGGSGGFRVLPDFGQLRESPLGFQEPVPELPEPPELNVIVVPALLVTPTGERLGYGAGFYDRVLGRNSRYSAALSVVVAFAEELVERLPSDEHDVRCDHVVTG